jgi:hypothetical protein
MTASVLNVFFLSRALDSAGGSIYVNLSLANEIVKQKGG